MRVKRNLADTETKSADSTGGYWHFFGTYSSIKPLTAESYPREFLIAKLPFMKLIIVSDFARTLGVRAISTVMLLVAAQVLLIGALARADADFRLNSPAFNSGAPIPTDFSCTAGDHSPALAWSGAPAGTKSFALIVEDPDAPMGTFVHWVVFNLPADASGIAADAPKTPQLADGATQGSNGMGAVGYKGPCPPPGKTHHYHFELFALDTTLDVPSAADAASLRAAMQNHVKASAELVGTFER